MASVGAESPLASRGVTTVADIEATILRAPPDLRANLAWAPLALALAFESLLTQSLTDELVATSTIEVFRILARYWELLGDTASIVDAERRDFEQAAIKDLHTYLPAAAADETEWALRTILSVVDFVNSVTTSEERTRALGAAHELPSMVRSRAAGGFLRAEALLMAILHALHETGQPHLARAAELADWAVVDAASHVRVLQGMGVQLVAFRESDEQFEARKFRYLDYAREVLTDDAAAAIETARLGRLR